MSLVKSRPDARGSGGPRYTGPSMVRLPHLMKQLWTDRIGMLADAAAEFGDVVRFSMGPKTIYFFNHPDHAKHVLADNAANYHKGMGMREARRVLGDGLLTSEGDIWRRQRRVTSPAFRRERIAGFASLVADAAEGLASRLAAHAGAGPVNISEEMTGLTLKVLGGTLLDTDLTPLRMIGPAFEVVQDQALFEMVTLGAVPLWLPLPRNQRFRAARRQLEDAVRTLVSERERTGGDGDLISMWLAAGFGSTQARSARPKLHDELVTILLAGHETTASTLSWTWYLLSQHPEVADRVRAEAMAAFADRTPTYEDLHRLPFPTTVIQEVMRLYPPVWGLTRVAQAADEIDGYRVPAGAEVMICTYTLHRHRGFWPAPDAFRPDRFAPGSADGPAHKYAYIPFGAGPRVCVGSHLGMLEATLVTAIVARQLSFSLPSGYRPVPEAMMSLRVRDGLRMNVHKA